MVACTELVAEGCKMVSSAKKTDKGKQTHQRNVIERMTHREQDNGL